MESVQLGSFNYSDERPILLLQTEKENELFDNQARFKSKRVEIGPKTDVTVSRNVAGFSDYIYGFPTQSGELLS